tara:strand:- start:115 stop:387 length:273 start_codon:yes stop_codon:yes gene_type:complete
MFDELAARYYKQIVKKIKEENMTKTIDMIKLPRYKENLRVVNGKDVYSYSTLVAEIKDDELHVFGWWSPTTSKHINYVADYYNLKKIDNV